MAYKISSNGIWQCCPSLPWSLQVFPLCPPPPLSPHCVPSPVTSRISYTSPLFPCLTLIITPLSHSLTFQFTLHSNLLHFSLHYAFLLLSPPPFSSLCLTSLRSLSSFVSLPFLCWPRCPLSCFLRLLCRPSPLLQLFFLCLGLHSVFFHFCPCYLPSAHPFSSSALLSAPFPFTSVPHSAFLRSSPLSTQVSNTYPCLATVWHCFRFSKE